MNFLPRTLAGAVILFSAIVVAALGAVGAVAHTRYGWPGVLAAAVAASVCWLGCVLGLVLTHQFQGTPNAVSGVLGAMVLRTGVPLIAGLVIASTLRNLADVGFVGWMLVLYLPALCAETLLSVGLINAARRESKVQ